MRILRVKNAITFLLLALFISMKMAGLHALSHNSDEEHALHCEICDHIIANQAIPAITPDFEEISFDIQEWHVPTMISLGYAFNISGSLPANQLFSRPPPVL